jgi:thymidine kinase
MNASKSAQLLMVAHNYEEANMKVMTVKPKIDTRDGAYIISRALDIKREVDLVVAVDDVNVIFTVVRDHDYDVVLVDEAQFLTRDQVDELSDIVDYLEIPVMAYGLRVDFKGEMFEGSKRLFENADKFQELKTICPCCGGKALINMRVDEETRKPIFGGDQVSPGNNYLPICRKYYKELKMRYGGGI